MNFDLSVYAGSSLWWFDFRPSRMRILYTGSTPGDILVSGPGHAGQRGSATNYNSGDWIIIQQLWYEPIAYIDFNGFDAGLQITGIEFEACEDYWSTTSSTTTTTSSSTTTTTTAPPLLNLVPDGDLSGSWTSFGPGGVGTGWDRLNSGILTPDDVGYIELGPTPTSWRGDFTDPDYPGTTTHIKVHVRARADTPQANHGRVLMMPTGTTPSGGAQTFTPTTAWANYTLTFSPIGAKDDSPFPTGTGGLQALVINDYAQDLEISEVEVEIVLP